MTVIGFPISAFAPLAVGFFGLGVGYLIYGPMELFGYPQRSQAADVGSGIWGIWMPGFMQFFAGVYLFAGLALFHSFDAPPLYMAALAFTAYGVHWWAIGLNRALHADVRTNVGMTVGYTLISIVGAVVFFLAGDWPVGLLFVGLTCIYVSDFVASAGVHQVSVPQVAGGSGAAAANPIGGTPKISVPKLEHTSIGVIGERSLGLFHLLTGIWLMYLTWATALNFSSGFHLPL